MFIRKVQIENFIPYWGAVEVHFPHGGGGNIYLIVGANGYGKTSFLRAVQWAFFGGKGTRHNDRKFNSKARSGGREDMAVTVVFEENDETFTLRRQHRLGRGEELILGTRRAQYEEEVAQEKVREIFPEHTARFFIFEAELVRELARAQGQEEAKKSIEILLGLQALRNAADDLESLERDFRKKLQKAQSQHEEFQAAKEAFNEIKDEIDDVDRKLSEKRERLQAYRVSSEQLEEKLAEVEQMRSLVETKRQLESDIGELESRQEELIERRMELVKDCHLLLVLQELAEAQRSLQEQLRRVSRVEEIVQERRTREKLVAGSIAANRCELCGRSPIDPEALRARSKLAGDEFSEELAGRSSAEIEEELRLVERAYREGTKELAGPLRHVLSGISSTQEEIRAKTRKIERIAEQIGDYDDSASEMTREAYKEAQKKINILEYEIEQLLGERGSLRDLESKQGSELKRYGDVERKFLRCIDQRKLAQSCHEAFGEILRRSVEMNRGRILEASNEFFGKLTNKPEEYDRFEFATEETYAFRLVRMDDSRPNMEMISDGEKEIVAMSFVLGLSRYSQITAPLIMDNVNSRLDGRHRSKLAKLLGSLDNQVIMLGIDKDFDWETRQVMKEAVCREYEIIRQGEEYSVIKEGT